MLVSVTRVLNEDDIIEAFVRHTACFVDRMMLLDNGSTDGTLAILAALRAEGLPVTVLQARSVHFMERQHNSLLYHAAVAAFRADWVLYLDADEFIDQRGQALRPALAGLPPSVGYATVTLRNHYAPPGSAPDLLVPRRFTLRDATDRALFKCIVRGGLPAGVTVEPGNHAVRLEGIPVPSASLAAVFLAHYPVRDAAAGIAKAVIGRAKVLAAGESEIAGQSSAHYTPQLDTMRDNPGLLLHNTDFMAGALPDLPLVHDPLDYAGGALCHTVASNPALSVVRRLAAAYEALARSHGQLLDADPAARQRLEHASMQPRVVIA